MAAAAESRKRVRYAAMPAHYSFRPFAVETMGSFGEDALQLVKELGGRLQASPVWRDKSHVIPLPEIQ